MKKYFNFFLAFSCFYLGACSRNVVRQPPSEIERPLFLPAKNWQLAFGGYVNHKLISQSPVNEPGIFTINDKTSWTPQFGLRWPSLHVGENFEIYLPSLLIYYLSKNTQVSNGIERSTGTNVALMNGIAGIVYSSAEGLQMATIHSIYFKLSDPLII